jgi:hypothetical protein
MDEKLSSDFYGMKGYRNFDFRKLQDAKIRKRFKITSYIRSLPCLTLRLLMSYIYGAPIFDVSRSHTTTQHSR